MTAGDVWSVADWGKRWVFHFSLNVINVIIRDHVKIQLKYISRKNLKKLFGNSTLEVILYDKFKSLCIIHVSLLKILPKEV